MIGVVRRRKVVDVEKAERKGFAQIGLNVENRTGSFV